MQHFLRENLSSKMIFSSTICIVYIAGGGNGTETFHSGEWHIGKKLALPIQKKFSYLRIFSPFIMARLALESQD
jgi:hypothetical protein